MRSVPALVVVSFFAIAGRSQTLWTGPTTTFTKASYADWTLEENQDRITDRVWITRANNQGIFNAATEGEFDRINRSSPEGTEWALGSITDGIENLTFTTWHETNVEPTHQQLGIQKVVHLIDEDIYIDVTFTQWTQGGGGSGTGMGGGFSYERSTDPAAGLDRPGQDVLRLYPNPSNGNIHLRGLTRPEYYRVFNLIGAEVASGTASPGEPIRLDLPGGSYFVQLESGTVEYLIIRP